MNILKKLFSNKYFYIYIFSYYGIWLIWSGIKIPFTNPKGVISYLPSIYYNPTDNILRFILAIFFPLTVCLLYIFITKNSFFNKIFAKELNKKILAILLILACILLSLAVGVVQSSTNPANNPIGEYGGPYSHAQLDTFHEGETLGPAISYQQKDLKPYRNFVVIHGVFQDPLRTVISFKLFGKSIGAERTFSVILIMLSFVLFYCLLLVIFKGNLYKATAGLGITAILTVPVNTIPLINEFFIGTQLPFRDIATMIFLILAIIGIRYCISNKKKLLTLASLAIGFVVVAGFANSIDRALYIAVLSGLYLFLVFLITTFRNFIKLVIFPFCVGILLGVPVLGAALKWDYYDFLRYLVNMSSYKDYLDGQVFQQPNLSVNVMLLAVGIVMSTSIFWMYNNAIKHKVIKSDIRSTLSATKPFMSKVISTYYMYILLFFTSVFFLRSAIGRADVPHFSYTIQWLYLFLTVLFLSYLYKTFKKDKTLINFLSILFLIFVLSYFAIRVRDINIRNDTFPLKISDSSFVRPDYIQTANYLDSHLKGNQSFVTLTSEASWYYLANKPCPISYPVIWYAFTSSQRTEVANEIKNNDSIKYIITNNNWTSDFDFVPNPTRFPEIYKILYAYYTPKIGIGQQTIWIRIK